MIMDIKCFDALYARLEDLKKCAVRGNLGVSAFFSPNECYVAENYLKKSGTPYIAYGGYGDAERKRFYILPEYMEEISSPDSFEEYGYSLKIDMISVLGSGFEKITHRAVMGSVLALGIERDVIGDILIKSEKEALIFCDSAMTSFIIENLERVGRDKITLKKLEYGTKISFERKFLTVTDTVASARLDCVVSALCSFSRERARVSIVSSLVELNYNCEERPDKEVTVPSIISVRGVGKFKVVSLSDKTKKGRYRLVAEKYL